MDPVKETVFRAIGLIAGCLVLMILPDISPASGRNNKPNSSDIIIVKVSYIIDGDSIMVKKDMRELEIRLWGIDSPEYDQPGSQESREALSSLILNKRITLAVIDRDKYGRLVAIATENGQNINENMVARGHAWVHVYYCKTVVCNQWFTLEDEARKRRLGLWKYENPISPWQWKAAKSGK